MLKGPRKVALLILTLLTVPLSAHAEPKLKIGVAGPFTGANATFGEQVFSGVRAYIASVNAKGGVDGRQIELVKGDDACEPKQSISVANRLVDHEKVSAVVGHFCSATSLPSSNIYDDAAILMVSPATTSPLFTERGVDIAFRACGRDDQQAVVAASFILDDLKRRKIALIHDKDAYGKGLVDALKASLEARGVTPVLYEGLTKGERDFNSLVTKIRSSGADAVYFGGLIPEGGPLIRQLREQGSDAVVVGGDAFAQAELVSAVGGPAYLKNVYYSATPDPLTDPVTKDAQDVLRKANIPPANYTLYGYAAAQIVVAALSGGRQNDVHAQIDWLRHNTLTTAIGNLEWNDKGDIANFRFVFFKFGEAGKAKPFEE